MSELNKILSICFFEAKQVFRTVVFKVFCIIQIPVFLFISRILKGNSIIVSSASIPYLYITYLNIIQVISVIFLTAHVFGKDKKFNTTPGLYSHSFSNAGYVLGKALGVFTVFILTSFMITLFAFSFQFFFMDIPVNYGLYLLYPVLIFLPTILFVIGLTAFITLLLRSEIISITLLIFLFVLVFPTFGSQFPNLWDFSGKNLPMLSTDFAGFGNLPLLLMQRGVFIFAGIGLIFLSGILFIFFRHPQSSAVNIVSILIAVLCLSSSSVLGYEYFTAKYKGKELRNRMRALEKSITNQPYLTMRTCSLELIHKKDKIEVKATISIGNTSPVAAKEYRFRLNPGLEVISVDRNNSPVRFERNIHILTLKPANPLPSGEKDSLVINYQGKIDENACYIDVDENEHERNNSTNFAVIDKRFAFITKNFVLLTQENQWYPTPFSPLTNNIFGSIRRDFTKFSLTVETDSSLTAIAQGITVKESPGKFKFTPEYPLTQISLAICDYEKHSTVLDGIEYAFYAKRGHDYISGLEKLSTKKIHEAINDKKREYELWMTTEYPFKRFSLVETPIQFISYNRDWRPVQEIVQPEQIYLNTLPHRFTLSFKLNRRLTWFNLLTDEEIQYMIFGYVIEDFCRTASDRGSIALKSQILKTTGFVGGYFATNSIPSFFYDYNVSPNYYFFSNSFPSVRYPLFDLAISYYFKEKERHGSQDHVTYNFKYSSSSDIFVKKILKNYSLNELFINPRLKNFIFYVLQSKSESLFATVKAQTGLTEQEFDDFLANYLKSHRFENVSAEDFFDTLKTSFNVDLTKYFREWQDENLFPKFEIHNPVLTYFMKDNYKANHYNLTVYNSGETGGAFLIGIGSLEIGTRRHFYLEKNQAKEISLVLYDFPDSLNGVGAVTYNAYNPWISDIKFKKQKIDNFIIPFEGERIVEFTPRPVSQDTIIVDDTSEGFKIAKQTNEGFLKKLINPYREDELDFSSFTIKNIPSRWTDFDSRYFYGINDGSVHCKKSGKGETKVSWDANLPSSGDYDVYYFVPQMHQLQIPAIREIYAVDDFHFFITNENGIEETIFDFKDAKEGWNYLGTYRFTTDKAHIELTDKSKGNLVYADAVMFVRK